MLLMLSNIPSRSLTTGHSKKMCFAVFIEPHTMGLISIPRPYRYLHVGILSCLHSNMKNLILFGHFSFQINLKSLLSIDRLLFWYFIWLW